MTPSDTLKEGQTVTVFDRYRFAKPVLAIIRHISVVNGTVRLEMLQSNNPKYPVGCNNIWVFKNQVRIAVPAPKHVNPFYREFRDAERRGDSVEVHRATGAWEKKSVGLAYHLPPDHYRISPKPTEFNFTQAIQGGTFIINFDKEKKVVYVEAIRRFADSDIVLCEKSSPAWPSGGGSLHIMDGMRDLSDFWRVFHQVEKDLADSPKPDPHSEFREAEKQGEAVQWMDSCGRWRNPTGPHTFCRAPSQYRIAPKEATMKMYWSPGHPKKAVFPTPLGKILLASVPGSTERQLRRADIPYLEALEAAGVAGAFGLIESIERHGKIVITEGM